uniref:Uncharacterized protein n=1 Tax=Steinernema glaseri TaxID=37863 RepID=A0A1I7Z9A9_9BILA
MAVLLTFEGTGNQKTSSKGCSHLGGSFKEGSVHKCHTVLTDLTRRRKQDKNDMFTRREPHNKIADQRSTSTCGTVLLTRYLGVDICDVYWSAASMWKLSDVSTIPKLVQPKQKPSVALTRTKISERPRCLKKTLWSTEQSLDNIVGQNTNRKRNRTSLAR